MLLLPRRSALGSWLLAGSNIFLVARATDRISSVATTPAPPLTIGDSLAVTWTLTTGDGEPLTTGDLKVYAVTLEPCASAEQSSCACDPAGNSLAVPLCESCIDSDQSYDVEVPRDTAAGVYVVRVSLSADPTAVFACSEGFSVLEEAQEDGGPGVEVEASSGSAGGAYVEALEGQSAAPGEAFTARWFYDDGSEEGEEGAAGDFAVDLYSCEGEACADGRCVHRPNAMHPSHRHSINFAHPHGSTVKCSCCGLSLLVEICLNCDSDAKLNLFHVESCLLQECAGTPDSAPESPSPDRPTAFKK